MKQLKHTWETAERFYIVLLHTDLFGFWILDVYWGEKRNKKRGSKVVACENYEDGLERFKKISELSETVCACI